MTEPMSSDQIRGWIQCLRKCKNNGGSCSSCAATEMRLIAEFDKLTAEVSRLRAERPKSYTPRDEVEAAGGWWSAFRPAAPGERQVIRAYKGHFKVRAAGYSEMLYLTDFTNFLPIPAYLIDGIESEVRDV